MNKPTFSDEELQNGFNLAYLLHPNSAVAYSVLLDGFDHYFELKKYQKDRPTPAIKPFLLRLNDNALLQIGIFSASDDWERDQENEIFSKTPVYEPNSNDLILRYIKFVVWKTMLRSSTHVATGIGSLLYTYRTSEINYICPDYFNSNNIRRNKSDLIKAIRERFHKYEIAPENYSFIITREPNITEKNLVYKSLKSFAPWFAEHAHCPSESTILETYFGYDSTKSDEDRNHALIDHNCAGFHRLVQEFNMSASMKTKMLLDNPENKLQVPDFGPDREPDDHDRFNPPSLRQTELISLSREINNRQKRRESYRPGNIRMNVDGKNYFLDPSKPNFENKITVPTESSFIKIFGEDEIGELLLKVIPFDQLNFDGHEQIEIPIEIGDEEQFSFLIKKQIDNSGILLEFHNTQEPLNADSEVQAAKPVEDLFPSLKKMKPHLSEYKSSYVQQFLWYCAGADKLILEYQYCTRERSKYELSGLLIVLLSLIATLSCSYTLYLALESHSIAIIGSIIWGILFFTLNRLVLTSAVRWDRHENPIRDWFVQIIPRFIIATLLGMIISEPLILKVFEKEINNQVALQKVQNVSQAALNTDVLFPEIKEIEDRNKQLEDNLESLQNKRDMLLAQVNGEIEGLSGTRKMGVGPVYRIKREQLEQIEKDLYDLRTTTYRDLTESNAKLIDLKSKRDSYVTQSIESQSNSGLLVRLSVLSNLKASDSNVQWIYWLFMGIICLFLMVPFMIKLLSPLGIYDLMLEETNKYNFELYKQDLLSEAQKKEINDVLQNVISIYSRLPLARSKIK